MPFAGFKNFADCKRKIKAKKGWKGKKGDLRASKYCGKIKHQVEDTKNELEKLKTNILNHLEENEKAKKEVEEMKKVLKKLEENINV